MAFGDLSDPKAVWSAIRECDELGRDAFLKRYAVGRARRYAINVNGRTYDAKAIVAAAHGYQFPDQGPLRADQFTSGLDTVVPRLRGMGFDVIDIRAPGAVEVPAPSLDLGRVYSWEELGEMLDFEPGYLTRAGGMVSRPALGMLLLITHPGGARTIDYGDYWEDDDLIYTGHGQRGDQRRTGTNRDLGDNARALHAFELAGSRQLRYLGRAVCTDEWVARAEDIDGTERDVLRFRLRFDAGGRAHADGGQSARADRRAAPVPTRRQPSATQVARTPRAFDPARRPTPGAQPTQRRTPEETAAETEKAVQRHHDLLVALDTRLHARDWTDIQEIPAAVDLWARDPGGQRVIFEAKTLAGSPLERLRSAAIQLLEYRYFYGDPADRLCIVTDRPISDRQARFLSSLTIAVIAVADDAIRPGSPLARTLVSSLLDGQTRDASAADGQAGLLEASFPSPQHPRPPDRTPAAHSAPRPRPSQRQSDRTR